MKKLSPAQKAVATRFARRELLDTYGCETYDVLELMMKGKSNVEVEMMLGVPMASVAAYRANLSRNTYGWILTHCNF